MRVESIELAVQRLIVEVVEKHSHAHAPVSCFQKEFQKNLTREILVPEEILDIQRAFRRIGQSHARVKGVDTVENRNESGLFEISLPRRQ